MKVKVKAQIELSDLFDSAHSQKEIHAMLEQLLNYASDESLIEEVRKRGLDCSTYGKKLKLQSKHNPNLYLKVIKAVPYRSVGNGGFVETNVFDSYKTALESVCENGISAGEFQIEEV